MTSLDPAISTAPTIDLRARATLYADLTKARLSALVLVTTLVGYLLGGLGVLYWPSLLATMVGTALAAACANALNQIIEHHRDARMPRTQARPLPSGSMSRRHALTVAIGSGVAGIGLLAIAVNLLSAALALLTIVLYAGVYTPLKTRTSLNTIIGAVCGAIPPMIGWAAATGSLSISQHAGAWILGAVLFVWQLPHFFALAWMYKDDYALGGFRMLPAVDLQTGEITARVMVISSLILVPVSLLMVTTDVSGMIYAGLAVLLGGWMVWRSVRFYTQRTRDRARAVFLASILYLPAVLCAMVVG